MTDVSVSPVKSTVAFHVDKISAAHKKGMDAYIELAICFANARATLNDEQFAELSGHFADWSASQISKLARVGKFALSLQEPQLACLPDSQSTLYLIARAPEDTRKRAFEEGVVNVKLTRDSWEEWVNKTKEIELLETLASKYGNISLNEAVEQLKQ